MSDPTEHFGLARVGPGESLADGGYKFGLADRDLIDLLLYLALSHEHTGGASSLAAPVAGPALVLDTSEGALPAGSRVYYAYTLVSPDGLESAPSPTLFLDTPPQVEAPAAPTAAGASSGGSLLPGVYYYVLSAYTGPNNSETAALYPVYLTVPGSTSTNEVTLTLPALPAGADGFNVYRRKPGGSRYLYLESIDMSVATPPGSWVDDGSADEDCDRYQPTVNTTENSNSVDATVPAAPAVGWQWRLYRSYDQANWTSSLHTTGATLTVTDAGEATTTGAPPGVSQDLPVPAKISLTDGTHVDGRLPLSQLSGVPQSIEFAFEGDVVAVSGTGVWTCEYPRFRVIGCRVSLGRGYMPAADPVIADVNLAVSSATPSFSTIFIDQNNRPRVLVGQQQGERTVPDIIEMVEGDMLTSDIDQAGGGATPTDRDAVVTVYGIAYGWTDPLSMDW